MSASRVIFFPDKIVLSEAELNKVLSIHREGGQRADDGHTVRSPNFPLKKVVRNLILSQVQFKKKEALATMPKSILKHRIHTATGQDAKKIEEALGYNQVRDGFGMDVAEYRKLARLIILEANGMLKEQTAKRPLPAAVAIAANASPPAKRKRKAAAVTPEPPAPANDEEDADGDTLAPLMSAASRKRPKSARRSEFVHTPVPAVAKRTSRRSLQTPMPAAASASVPVLPTTSTLRQPPTKTRSMGYPGPTYTGPDGEGRKSNIYLVAARNSPTSVALRYRELKAAVPDFPGFNLSVLHTLADWGPPEVFSAVQAIRFLNRDAQLDSFLVLVGCGLSNVHMYMEALARQTSHVQFVVLEREDQDPATGFNYGRLRETTSYFLLAYFFPGSDRSGSKLPQRMVRDGATTCLRAASTEELENAIVHTLTEEGDWILDFACRRRELILAAQKSARCGIAIEENADHLADVSAKAHQIARAHTVKYTASNGGNIIRMK